MGFGINLRGDLAKLSDAELAQRLDQMSRALDIAAKEPRWTGIKLWFSFRGPSGILGSIRYFP